MDAYSMNTLTDENKSSAADWGMQPAQYDEMDMADQLQQKLNNALPPEFQSPSLFSFSLTRRPPTQLHLFTLYHHHPFFFLPSKLSAPIVVHFIFLMSLNSLSPFFPLPPPAPRFPTLRSAFLLKTDWTQTDSGAERHHRSDPCYEL